MYDAIADPYCYPGTTVLKNIPGIRDQAALDAFEAISTTQRADEPLPKGRFGVTHYRAIHHHLFQDVYEWAGEFRTIRTSKGGNMFCYPENIEREMKSLFAALTGDRALRGLPSGAFSSKAAHALATLNAIHPFREGNGRSQTSFLVLLAIHAGHQPKLEKLDPVAYLQATIKSFHGDENSLADQIELLIS